MIIKKESHRIAENILFKNYKLYKGKDEKISYPVAKIESIYDVNYHSGNILKINNITISLKDAKTLGDLLRILITNGVSSGVINNASYNALPLIVIDNFTNTEVSIQPALMSPIAVEENVEYIYQTPEGKNLPSNIVEGYMFFTPSLNNKIYKKKKHSSLIITANLDNIKTFREGYNCVNIKELP